MRDLLKQDGVGFVKKTYITQNNKSKFLLTHDLLNPHAVNLEIGPTFIAMYP